MWTERSYPFTITAMYTYQTKSGGEILYAASDAGKVFELEVGDQDEDADATATAITWNAKMNANWFGNKRQTKRFRRVAVVTDRNRDITFKSYVDSVVAKQTKTLEAPTTTNWGGFTWGDGTTWVSRRDRDIREGLNDTNVGHNIQAEVSGIGPNRVESVPVDMTRIRD